MPADVVVEVEQGTILLDAALDNDLEINYQCGGNCGCSTCHVVIEEGIDSLAERSDDEEDMLEEVEDLFDNSRLACQCEIQDDLVVTIPQEA